MSTDTTSLDRSVAERVMGWQHPDGWLFEEDGMAWLTTQSTRACDKWSPSTDIAAAWDVVAKMRELRPKSAVVCRVGDSWSASFGENETGSDPSPCIAICRAALAAVTKEQAT